MFKVEKNEYKVEMLVEVKEDMGSFRGWVCAFDPETKVCFDPVYNKLDAEGLLNIVKRKYADLRSSVPSPEELPEEFRIVRRPVGQWEVI